MANTLTVIARQSMLLGDFHWENDTFKVMLVSTDYQYQATHKFLSDVSTTARIGQPVTLEQRTVTTDGAADAADCTFPSVSGNTVTRIIIYKDTGVETTSSLVAIIDTATGLPLTPNGGDIRVVWDNGINKIFRP